MTAWRWFRGVEWRYTRQRLFSYISTHLKLLLLCQLNSLLFQQIVKYAFVNQVPHLLLRTVALLVRKDLGHVFMLEPHLTLHPVLPLHLLVLTCLVLRLLLLRRRWRVMLVDDGIPAVADHLAFIYLEARLLDPRRKDLKELD